MSDFPTTPLPAPTPGQNGAEPAPAPAPAPADAQPTVPLTVAAPVGVAPDAQPTMPLNPGGDTPHPGDAQPTTPLKTDAWASTIRPSPEMTSPASAPRRNRPRFSTILWGVLLLVFAGFMVAWTVLPTAPDPTLLLLGAVIAIGIALVAAGIAAASRRAG